MFDGLPLDKIADAEAIIRLEIVEKLPDVCQRIERGDKLIEGDLALYSIDIGRYFSNLSYTGWIFRKFLYDK